MASSGPDRTMRRLPCDGAVVRARRAVEGAATIVRMLPEADVGQLERWRWTGGASS
jgi:hypothetical protein